MEEMEVAAVKTTAKYIHCVEVYRTMKEQAQVQELYPNSEDSVEGLVYEGFLTKLFESLSLAVPYYTTIIRELKRMGCVEQLRRGGSTTPSRWQLLKDPSPELAATDVPVKPITKAQKQARADVQDQQIRGLSKRIDDLEALVEQLLEALTTHE
jgi:hypothetical protein